VNRKTAEVKEGDVDIAIRSDDRMGVSDKPKAGGRRLPRVLGVEDHRLREITTGRSLRLKLPVQAVVAGDGEQDLAAAGGVGLNRELASRVVARPHLVEVAVVGVGLAVGQGGEGVDGQVRLDLEEDRVLA